MRSLVSEQKSTRYFNLSFFAILTMGLAGLIIYYWQLGFLNPQESIQLLETNSRFEEISQLKRYDSFMGFIKESKARQSVLEFEQFERSVKKVQEHIPNSDFDNKMSLEGVKLKKSLATLISLPDVNSVQKVLRTKIQQFIDFTTVRKYPTLKKSAERMQERLDGDRKFTAMDLNAFSNGMRSEQELMEKVVMTSTLKDEEKNEALARVRSFAIEVSALESLARNSSDLIKIGQSYKSLLQDWVKVTGPQVAGLQMRFEKRNQSFATAMAGYLSFLILLSMIHAKIMDSFQTKIRKETENNISQWLKRGLVKDEAVAFFMGPELSKDFESLKTYILKRIQFSSNFQEALPFAAILLDNSLRVTWANDLFCETWGIDPNEIKTQGLSWDYLSRITNLGGDDPIVESFQKNIPGIYQIQIRPDSSKTRIPFEMYLSPLGDGSSRKMMIFFYPLISLEETISNQAKALIGPVDKLLTQISHGQWSTETREVLGHEFEIAGISQLFEKFNSYIESQTLQRQGLLKEIDGLESQVQDYHKLVSDLEQILGSGKLETQDFRNHLQRNRETVVQLVDTVHSFDHLSQNVLNSLEKNIYLVNDLAEKGVGLTRYLQEGANMAETVGNLRVDVKKSKEIMSDAKAKFLQVIDQAILFQNRGQWEPHQLEMTFNRIKNQARDFDETVSQLEKQMSIFDVMLSKLRMVLEEYEQVERIVAPNNLQQAGELSDFQIKYNEQNQNTFAIQEELVSSFEELAHRLKRIRTSWERASYLGHEALKIHDRGPSFATQVESRIEYQEGGQQVRAIRSINPSPSV